MLNFLFIGAMFQICVLSAFGAVSLPSILSSHMVLQQNKQVKIWGLAHPGEEVRISVGWDTVSYRTVTNSKTAKWDVSIQTPSAGGPYRILVEGENKIVLDDVLIGEVWLCGGQSNMQLSANDGNRQAQEEAPNATNAQIRLFLVTRYAADFPQEEAIGKWVVCNPEDMKAFSAVGYFFGKQLQEKLGIPVGLINSNWGGTGVESWSPREIIERNETFREDAVKMAATNDCCPSDIATLFNSMIYPLTKFPISGVIWYQGETNRFNYMHYPDLLSSMVREWRKRWAEAFPFYFVQIAPYSNGGLKNYVALMREAQGKCLAKIPGSRMVVISDLIDNLDDIHPKNKKDVGIRLANYALAETYGIKLGGYKSPSYEHMEVKGSRIRITFRDAGDGLVSKGDSVTGFFVAGADKIFYPAQAVIEGNTALISSPGVPHPVAARYGFWNEAVPAVFNKAGLPLNLFRTDDWSVDTVPVGWNRSEKNHK
jgi:sialate O-acetylesterase